MNDKQLSKRCFLMAFSLTFFIISAITVVLMQFFVPEKVSAGSQSQSPVVYYPNDDDKMTILFMGIEQKDAVSFTYLLANFNPVSGHISVTSLPPQTKVKIDGKDGVLYEAYRFGGYAMAARSLEQSYNLKIDRYVRINIDAFVEVAKLIGAVNYDLKYELDYEDEEYSAELSKGLQLVDGQKASDITRYPAYTGGEITRAEVVADLAATIINEKISIVSSPIVESLFKAVVNLVETNITMMDFQQRRNAAIFLSRLDYNPATNFPISGEFNHEGNTLTLSENTIQSLQRLYG